MAPLSPANSLVYPRRGVAFSIDQQDARFEVQSDMLGLPGGR